MHEMWWEELRQVEANGVRTQIRDKIKAGCGEKAKMTKCATYLWKEEDIHI